MDAQQLLEIIKRGEDSNNQFKEIFNSSDSLAAELGAFSNSKGGNLFVGIADDGSIKGLTKEAVGKLNQMISNVCSQKIDPSISVTTENIILNENIVVVISVPAGKNKFYISNGSDIWVKVGADKRKAKREEMRRLLQESSQIYADEQIVENTQINDLDLYLVREFIEKRMEEKLEDITEPIERILNSMKVMGNSKCTLAGLLLFGKKSTFELSQYGIGAVCWFGNDLSGVKYRDSMDIYGNISVLFSEGIAFIKRQLKRVQGEQGFNSLGILEIPEIALEEVLVNAIVHRNYFISSNIRILIFDNRVEIISPGVLPNTLNVEAIQMGVHIARNPVLLSHTKDIPGIPYRGMGTGISRINKSCFKQGIKVEFLNQIEQNYFKVVFCRKDIH